ncbi:MAG: ATP-dependent Clp protease adapter ClpS [Sphingomonadales bacterium]
MSTVKTYTPRAGKWDKDDRPETGTITKTRPKTKKPRLFKVLLLNDDFTPMDFVIHVLQKFFHMSLDHATGVMLNVHTKGIGVCGVFTHEIAETKVTNVMDYAKKHQHPLQCTLEQE